MYGDSFIERIAGALRLDVQLYEQVSTDSAAGGQAWRLILLTGITTGLGLAGRPSIFGLVAGLVSAVFGWLLWSAVILGVARAWRYQKADHSLLRAMAFANAPGLFLVLGIVPGLGRIARTLVVVYLLAATASAVQAVFSVSRWRATVVTVIAFVAYLIVGLLSASFAAS